MSDPDLVEENSKLLRTSKCPLILKYILIFVFAAIWKWWYYSPNTFKHYYINKIDRQQLKRKDTKEPFSLTDLFIGTDKIVEIPWLNGTMKAMVSYFVFTFVLLPTAWGLVAFMLFGNEFDVFQNALKNVILAEILTNIHGFIVIVPNHAGKDIYLSLIHI